MTKGGLLAAVFLAGCASVPVDESVPPTVVLPYVRSFSDNEPGTKMPTGWREWTLSRFKKPTQYLLVDDAGRTVVKAHAESSASGLVHPLTIDPQVYPMLSWSWKVNDLIAGADNTRKNTEDSPVRLVVSFEGNLDDLSLDDRLFFDNVRLATGQQLPYATLMYIWENRLPEGTIITHHMTSRVKMVVAGSGTRDLNTWHDERHNVLADYRRAFGEEPPRVASVGIMSDSDNTGASVTAYFGDIRFVRGQTP